jgi:hypothetical protein
MLIKGLFLSRVQKLYEQFHDVSVGNGGPGSSVGIATGYGLDGPGIE